MQPMLEAFVSITDFESADLTVNGLTVVERIIKVLTKQNVQVVLCGPESVRNKLKEYCAQFQLTFINQSEVLQERNCLLLSGDVQYSLKFIPLALKKIRQNLQSSHQFHLPSGELIPFEWKDGDEIVGYTVDQDAFAKVRIQNEPSWRQSKKELETKQFSEIYAGTEGWIARALNKKISFKLTSMLLRLPITPNQITVFCFGLGLLGCILLALPDYFLRVLGAVLLQFNSILDGCDGEVARLKIETSRMGAWMDTISDDVLNNVMFACLYIGYIGQHFDETLLKFCILTTVASLGMSFFLYHFMITHNDPNAAHYQLSWQTNSSEKPSGKTIFDLVKHLLKRDFFIFVVMIAIILDLRLMLILGSGLIWIGFGLYMISFFHSFLQSRRS